MTKRRAAWQFERREVVSAGGLTIVVLDVVPPDSLDELQACDLVHQGANPTDLAIGYVNETFQSVLIVSSATDPARPAAGVPVTIKAPTLVPPGWSLIGAAQSLNPGETMSIRALWRRV